MRRVFLSALVALLLASFTTVRAFALDLGDEAPGIDVTEWVCGSPVDLAAGKDKNTFVVAFLATFDPGSQAAFKQLSKLSEANKGKGLVVVAICNQTPDKLKEWLAENPQPFAVAADPRSNTVAPYMKNQDGVPHVFIVGKPGTVFWHGSPTVGFEEVLTKVLAGTYDAAHEKAVAEARTNMIKGLMKRSPKFFGPPLDELLRLEPTDKQALQIKLQVLQRPDENGDAPKPETFHAFCAEHLKKVQDDADCLNMIAWDLLTNGDFAWRKPDLGIEAAKRAVEVCEGKKAGIVDSLARGYFEIGNVKQAVEVQKQAIAVAEEADEKANLEKTLAYYEMCLKLGEKSGGDKPGGKPGGKPTGKPKGK